MTKISIQSVSPVSTSIRTALQLASRESINASLLAIFGGIFVFGVEISIAVFFQLFLKALGLSAEASGAWSFLTNTTLTAIQISMLLATIGLLRGTFNVLVAQGIVFSNESFVAKLRIKLFENILLSDRATYIDSAKINFLASEVIPKMGLFWGNATQLISVGIMTLGVGIAMMSSALIHTMIGIFGLGCVGLVIIRINSAVLQSSRQLPIEQQILLNGAQRVGRNWLLIRILRTSLIEFLPLKNAANSYLNSSKRASFWTYVGAETPPTLGIALLMVIIYIQLAWNISPNGQFLVFLYLFMRFSQYIGSVARCIGTAATLYPTFNLGIEFFSNSQEPETPAPLSIGASTSTHEKDTTPIGAPTIVLDRIKFAYSADSSFGLDNLSLSVRSGEHLGIVGQSGSGKSTLLSIILGVLSPKSGTVLLANLPPEDFFNAHSSKVGYVGAEPFLFSGTIRENLTYGFTGTPSDAECWAALQQASLSELVKSKSDGLNFKINENSDGLSAGQKQRLALARALLRKPTLLILDEASANVDEVTESELSEVIARLKGQTTCILVSHRPGFLKHVDNILRLGN